MNQANLTVEERTHQLYLKHLSTIDRQSDLMFGGLLLIQWIICPLLALLSEPESRQTRLLAGLIGGLLACLPAILCFIQPGLRFNRFAVAVGQMAMSGLLIYLSGGHIETHFHVFVSLTLLGFYRDAWVFVPAILVALLDHSIRGWYWPATLYETSLPEVWRTVKFIGWMGVETMVLVYLCKLSWREMLQLAGQRAKLESTNQNVEAAVAQRTEELKQKEQGLQAMVARLSAVIHQVRMSGIQVTGATTSIAASARQQEASIAEQAAAAAQIWSTSREISATSKELVGTMDGVAKAAEDTGALASDGAQFLAEMQSGMAHVVGASTAIVSKLAVLSEKANKINSVVTTISKVADQTNLLSLNAAIEAEKAGEAGRGFGVVATEIRRLADQTAVATLDIDQVIKEMQSAVSVGVMGMDKFTDEVRRSEESVSRVAERLGSIMERVQGMTRRFEEVNYGMKSQAQGASQIAESISQMAQAAQQTSASVRDFTTVINQLQSATQGLQVIVSEAQASPDLSSTPAGNADG